MQIPCILKKCLLCTFWLFRQIIPFNKFQCFKTLIQEGQKRSLFTWLLTFIPPAFVQTFYQNRFFHHLNFLLNYTLLILRFGDQICLNLSASWQPIILDKPGDLRGNSSCHSDIIHVYIISCQAPNFQYQGRTAEEKAFTQRTFLFLIPYSMDMTIYWWYSQGSS